MSGILALMIGISVFLGACIVFGVVWGVKNHQFEDYSKFLDGTKFDSEEALNEAYQMELKRKNALKKKTKKDDSYKLPD